MLAYIHRSRPLRHSTGTYLEAVTAGANLLPPSFCDALPMLEIKKQMEVCWEVPCRMARVLATHSFLRHRSLGDPPLSRATVPADNALQLFALLGCSIDDQSDGDDCQAGYELLPVEEAVRLNHAKPPCAAFAALREHLPSGSGYTFENGFNPRAIVHSSSGHL